MNPVNNLVRNALEKDSLNVAIFNSGEEKFVRLIAESCPRHNFYIWTSNYNFSWNREFCSIKDLPNITVLENNFDKISILLPIDMIICQDRTDQFRVAKVLSSNFHIPLVLINHTTPIHCLSHEVGSSPKIPQSEWQKIFSSNGDVNIFTSEAAQKEWKVDGFVLKPWINMSELDTVKEKENYIGVSPDLNETELAGAKYICGNYQIKKYNETYSCKLFLNLKQGSIPIEVLECMARGIPTISVHSKEMEELVNHYQNGVLCHTIPEMQQITSVIMQNDNLSLKMGEKAREKCKEYCNFNFKEKLNSLLNFASERIYLR